MGKAIARVLRKILARRRRAYRFGTFAIGEREMQDIGKLFE